MVWWTDRTVRIRVASAAETDRAVSTVWVWRLAPANGTSAESAMETTYASTARAHQMDRSRSISVENVEVRTSAWDATRSPTVAWNSIFVTSVGEMAQAARDAMVFPTPDWSWITVVCAEVTIAHAVVRKVSAADTENAIVPSRPAAATPVGQDPFATNARISAEGRTATAGEIARPTLESANARKPGLDPPASTRPADP